MMPNRNQDPDWREFERLVARIEADASPRGIVVTSPDRIRCNVTGKLREVDASIRSTVGTAEVLITIECRLRSRVQDVTWIEQLIAKKQSIGADRTIAVSATGFSQDAKTVAAAGGITLRRLSEIGVEDINALLKLDFVLFWHKTCAITRVGVRKFRSLDWRIPANVGDVDFHLPETIDPLAEIFSSSETRERWSLNDLWHQVQEVADPFAGVAKNEAPALRTACFPYPGTVALTFSGEEHILGDVILTMKLWIEAEKVSINDALKVNYGADGITNLQRVEFASQNSTTNDSRISLQIPEDSDDIQDIVVGGNYPAERD